MEDFFDLVSLSSLQPLPRKRGVAIITNAGGPGILTADACEKAGLTLASFSRRTVNQLAKVLPAAANLYNPVDILGDAAADRYLNASKVVAADSGVGSIIAVLTPQAVTDIEGSAQAIVELANSVDKPVVGCFLGGKDVEAGVAILNRGGVPNFRFPERAAAALAKLHHYSEHRRQKYTKPPVFKVSREKVRRLVGESRRGGSLHIGGFHALDILKFYGINVPRGRLAHSPAEAASIAAGIGFPVVMKVVSPNILHKSDVGGVRTGIDSQEEARRSFEEIKVSVTATMPDALFLGVAVQEQVMGAREVIIGSTNDPQFGPLLMFGLGGIYVEILKDVSFRIAPICSQEAWQMVTEIKSYPLLAGSRGEEPADCKAIVDALLRCSQLVMDFKEIVEMDLNPLLVGPRGAGAWVADARFVIRP
jgi:acetyltransferase